MVTLITVAALVLIGAALVINSRLPREHDDKELEERDA